MLDPVFTTKNDVVVAGHRRPNARACGSAARLRRIVGPALFASLVGVLGSHALAAPPDSPLVTMQITLPNGEARTAAAHDSETVTVALADGSVLGVRPTILDSKPWNRTLVTFFAMPTSTKSAEEIGVVEVRTGGPSVSLKALPGLKIAVATTAMEPVDRLSHARATPAEDRSSQ